MSARELSGPPPDDPLLEVPVRRGVVVAVILVTIVGAFVAAWVWWTTFPDVDDDAPPAGVPAWTDDDGD